MGSVNRRQAAPCRLDAVRSRSETMCRHAVRVARTEDDHRLSAEAFSPCDLPGNRGLLYLIAIDFCGLLVRASWCLVHLTEEREVNA